MDDANRRRRESLEATERIHEIGYELQALVEVLDHTVPVDVRRVVIEPGRPRGEQQFQVGKGKGPKGRRIIADEDNDAYLRWGEACADYGYTGLLGKQARAQYETVDADPIIRCRCGALYSAHAEYWLGGSRLACEACEHGVDAYDGGPMLCARCRAIQGVRTVCAGCARLYMAKPRPEAKDPDTRPLHPTSYWNRLCPNCKNPAGQGDPRPTKESLAAFEEAVNRYGSEGQMEHALKVARSLHVVGMPADDFPSLWSDKETQTVTEWLESRHVTTH